MMPLLDYQDDDERCAHCGERIGGDDRGGWLHLSWTGMPGARQCAPTFAEPEHELARRLFDGEA